MNNLSQYIIEKLHLNKDIHHQFNIDNISPNDEVYLYDDDADVEEEGDRDIFWDDCKSELDTINKNYTGFIAFQFDSLGSIKKDITDDVIYNFSDDLDKITDKIITGKDLGYNVLIKGGHLEIHALNSGSRGIYYIYALTNDGYNICYDYIVRGEEEPENLNLLKTDEENKYITPIEL
jgi:hypothetical protein